MNDMEQKIADAFTDAIALIDEVDRARKAPASAGRHVLDGTPYEIAKAFVGLCAPHKVPALAPWLAGITPDEAKVLKATTEMRLAWFKANGPHAANYYKAMLNTVCAGEEWKPTEELVYRVELRWVEAKSAAAEEARPSTERGEANSSRTA